MKRNTFFSLLVVGLTVGYALTAPAVQTQGKPAVQIPQSGVPERDE